MTPFSLLGPLLAGQPLLPAGKGGLILIAGGLVMVTVALFWLTITPRSTMLVSHASIYHTEADHRRNGSRGVTERQAPVLERAIPAKGDGPRPWAAFIEGAAQGSGYESAQVQSLEGARCTIRIDHTDSRILCKDEERCLRRAAHRIARGAKVHEVSCGAYCVFEIKLRGR